MKTGTSLSEAYPKATITGKPSSAPSTSDTSDDASDSSDGSEDESQAETSDEVSDTGEKQRIFRELRRIK